MEAYKTSRSICLEHLTYVGFVPGSAKKRTIKRTYLLRKKIDVNSYLDVIITQIGKRFYYNSKKGSILYIDNDCKYPSTPLEVENHPALKRTNILEKYKEQMDELVDAGILTKRLKFKKE